MGGVEVVVCSNVFFKEFSQFLLISQPYPHKNRKRYHKCGNINLVDPYLSQIECRGTCEGGDGSSDVSELRILVTFPLA